MSAKREVHVSVDVETSGPIPGEYSMLVFGACLVDDDRQAFSCRIKPTSRNFVPEAMAATGLSLDELERDGLVPEEAMAEVARWLREACGPDANPVFVGLNAPFDWSFVNYYFHRYAGENPFGFTAVDIKALYMGATGCAWGETRSSLMDGVLGTTLAPNHDALQDARYQAELFRLVRSLGGRTAAG